MNAIPQFFREQVMNETMALYARQTLKRRGDNFQRKMGLASRSGTAMAGMATRVVGNY